nr:nuclear egress membrane protein UL34 [Psittacid alphaherpesvirus 6]
MTILGRRRSGCFNREFQKNGCGEFCGPFSVVGNSGGGLMSRIKMVMPCDLKAGEHDPLLSSVCSGRLPTRCAFQFSTVDGSDCAFQVEYIMRMMADWAYGMRCDPYLRFQNTGVSMLLQGYFDPPAGAERAPVSPERGNIVLGTTEATGLSLLDIERMKTEFGVDARPLRACLAIHCFVRLPKIQLAVRFVGPSDPTRLARLMDAANEAMMTELTESETSLGKRRKDSMVSPAWPTRRATDRNCRRRYSSASEEDDVDNCQRYQRLNCTKNSGAPLKQSAGTWTDKLSRMLAVLLPTKDHDLVRSNTIEVNADIADLSDTGTRRATVRQTAFTACVTSVVTLALWILVWSIKDRVAFY